jgi:hypothetical protein
MRMMDSETAVLYESDLKAFLDLDVKHKSIVSVPTQQLYNVITLCNTILSEVDGRVVSALGVRSRKLSTGLNGQS